MDWDEVEDLFARGLHSDAAARDAILVGIDSEAAVTVRVLWLNADRAANFLAASPAVSGRRPLRAPHEVVAGRFTLLEFLGAGGMGEVFSARDDRLGRRVALKFLAPDMASQPAVRDRLEHEARALCRLSHPHVCILHDFAWDSDVPFLVMEYLDGETLASRLASGALPLPEVLSIARQLLAGLSHAHHAGIVHRDLKPGNIMVTAQGAKIFDFGIARQLQSTVHPNTATTNVSTIIGSASYMSPEQAEGKPVDHRTDVFAFGCVLYEMLTGRKAFAGNSYVSTVAAVLKDEPPPPRQLRPDVPVQLQAVVETCLKKEPEARFQSAHDVQRALDESLADSPDAAQSEHPRVTVLSRVVSRRMLVTVATAMLLLVGGLLLTIGRWHPTSPSRDAPLSIAVLPFTNVARDAELEYLAAGLAESLTNSLARIASLRVSARSIAFRYKGEDVDVRKVGRELGVQAVVMGRVSRGRDGQVRVQADLVSASTATEMWGEQFAGNESEFLQIETELVRKLSGQLHVDRSDGPVSSASRSATSNPEAYRLYLRGRFALSRSTVPETQNAITFFQNALALDPTFALAHSGLADSYIGLSGYLKPVDAMAKAKAAAIRATELDSSLPEAHLNLGVIKALFDFDWRPAEIEFRRVIQSQPNVAYGHLWLAWVLFTTGRQKEAIAEAQRAHELEPLDAFIETGMGQMYSWSGQHELAIQRLRAVVASDPKFFNGHYFLGNAYVYAGRYAEGIPELEYTRTLDPTDPRPLAYLAYAYSRIGQGDKAKALLSELLKRREGSYAGAYFLAIAAIANGSEQEAMQWLEQAYADREDPITFLKMDPPFEPIRTSERFRRLARLVGLE